MENLVWRVKFVAETCGGSATEIEVRSYRERPLRATRSSACRLKTENGLRLPFSAGQQGVSEQIELLDAFGLYAHSDRAIGRLHNELLR